VPNVLWRSKQARLLFFFIAEKKRVTKDEIALTFWPDFTPEKVTSNFHATMWRLRQAVGQDTLVFEDEVYSLSPRASVWYDVEDFSVFTKRGNDKSLPDEERAEAWRRALDLYQGPFLVGAEMEWAEERRRYLENQLRLGLSYLGKWELDRHHYEAAETFYQSFLQLEPYSDEAELGLMKSLIGLGDIAGARDSYLAYHKRLGAELKTSPSPALQDLFRQLGPG
jgi:two-component SAPR family response regulator